MLPAEDISMFNKKWKTEIFTIPNLLSLFRLLLIPAYLVLYLNATEPKQYWIAGLILAISCLTDAIDGKIARHFHMVSTVGKILDPLADKVTQFVLTICLSLKYPALNPVLVLFVFKELFQLITGIIYLRKGKMLSGALPAGKVSTAVLFASLTLLVFFPSLPAGFVKTIALMDSIFLIISFVSYYCAYFGNAEKLQDWGT